MNIFVFNSNIDKKIVMKSNKIFFMFNKYLLIMYNIYIQKYSLTKLLYNNINDFLIWFKNKNGVL